MRPSCRRTLIRAVVFTGLVTCVHVISLAFAGDFSWGVHLASYRSEGNAVKGWQQLVRMHHAALNGRQHRIVPVDIPGKGRYLRLLVAPLESREAATALQNAIRARGGYADAMTCPHIAPAQEKKRHMVSVAAPVTPAAPLPVTAVVPRKPVAPQVRKVAIHDKTTKPAMPQSVSPERSPERSVVRSDAAAPVPGQGLRKYVPLPKTAANAAVRGLTPEEQQSRELLPSPPSRYDDSGPGYGRRVGFRDDQEDAEGLTLARPRNKIGRISALYGNMDEDFEEMPKAAPVSAGQREKQFKPYVGFGLHF